MIVGFDERVIHLDLNMIDGRARYSMTLQVLMTQDQV